MNLLSLICDCEKTTEHYEYANVTVDIKGEVAYMFRCPSFGKTEWRGER